jgi:hypothetical protein
MPVDRCGLYTYRLHRRVVSFRNVNARGSNRAYHRDHGGEYEKRNTIHWTLHIFMETRRSSVLFR